MSAWRAALYAELEAMTPLEQVVATGAWITAMTQEILPELGVRRREAILAAIAADPEGGAARVAESIGSRPGTIARLAAEARTARRRNGHLAATPPLG
jgi:hypothetical protein